jgi:GTPase Era involved in 16S rRNA processing
VEEKYINRLSDLQNTVKDALDYLSKAGITGDIKVDLENLQKNLNAFISLVDRKRNPRVGVFGCPGRGKSTLLNVLLGVDILPMKGRPGTTRFGIELSYKDSAQFEITREYKNKAPETSYCCKDEVKNKLEDLSKNADTANSDITKIIVQGPFQYLLGNGFDFFDTPGIELEAIKDSEEQNISGHNYGADATRALNILSTVDVVIFCMRNDYKERKDANFYKNEIKDKYKTINVITHGNARNTGQTNDEIKQELQKNYQLDEKYTVIVDSKQALEKYYVELEGENLKGFKELRRLIAEKARTSDADIRCYIENFERLYGTLWDTSKGIPEYIPSVHNKEEKEFAKIEGEKIAKEIQNYIEHIRQTERTLKEKSDKIQKCLIFGKQKLIDEWQSLYTKKENSSNELENFIMISIGSIRTRSKGFLEAMYETLSDMEKEYHWDIKYPIRKIIAGISKFTDDQQDTYLLLEDRLAEKDLIDKAQTDMIIALKQKLEKYEVIEQNISELVIAQKVQSKNNIGLVSFILSIIAVAASMISIICMLLNKV